MVLEWTNRKKIRNFEGKMNLFLMGFFLVGLFSSTGWTEEFAYVSFADLNSMIQSKAPAIVIVDTQPAQAYQKGHIKGAVNLPWSMDLKSPQDLSYDKTLILYCDCPAEEDAIDVARQLREKWAYENIKILKGSWSEWKEAGMPAEIK